MYDLFVISSIWGGGAAPSPPTPLQQIEEMRKQEDEETKRRRNEPLQLKLSGEKYATCPKEDTRNRRNRGNEEARRRRNEETKKRTPTAEAIGEKINAEWRLFLLRRPSTWISSNIFFDPPWRRGFQLLSQVRDDFVCAIFFFDALNIFLLMRHPSPSLVRCRSFPACIFKAQDE